MKRLFSPEGDAALLATMAQRPLLAFDFDGTLAPIVAHPDDVRVPQGVSDRLARLCRLLTVAVISGRALDDLKPRIAFQPHYLVGSHGAEDPDDAHAFAWADALDGFRASLLARRDELAAAGVEIEDKRYSIALHYRLASNQQEAVRLVTQVLTSVDGRLAVFGGKMVANVVAAQAPDKAHAVARLVKRCGASCAVFVGDDINDEPVFARNEPSWLTVRVGQSYPNSQAKFFVDDSKDIEFMLERMLFALGSPST